MPSRKGSAFSDFRRSVYEATTKKLFADKFLQLCRSADRREMIKLLMNIEEVKNLKIGESYREKNDAEAQKIHAASGSVNIEAGEASIRLKVSFLTKALFAANSTSSLFAEILVERARCWYRIGAYARCVKDCDYLIDLATGSGRLSEENESQNNARLTECVALRAKCTETSRRANKISNKKQSNKIVVTSGKLPTIDGKSNTALKSCSDAVKLSYDKTRGRHLVATRNIKTGSVLIVDQPFATSTDPHALKTNCLHCHASLDHEENVKIPCENCQSVAYCSNACRKESWKNYHRYECTIFDYFFETDSRDIDHSEEHRSHLLLAWRTTIVKAIDRSSNLLSDEFLRYEEIGSMEKSDDREIHETVDPYDPLDYRTVIALQTHCSDSSIVTNLQRSLRAIFLAKCLKSVLSKIHQPRRIETNAEKELILVAVAMLRHMQAVDCNAYEIVENSRDEGTKIWEPRNVGGAIYSTVSLVNHGCYPNVVRHSYPGGKVVVRALRFIGKGTEILDCYGPHFLSESRTSRRRYLLEKYHFACVCEACTNDWQLPDDKLLAYKCSTCEESVPGGEHRCPKCSRAIEAKKLEAHLAKSVKKRIHAISRMFEGNYAEALPNLLEHANLIDKILAVPSLEAIKTQQSIVQCYNSLASTCPSNHMAN